MSTRIDVHAHYVGGIIGSRLNGAPLRGGDPAPSWDVDDVLSFMDDFDIAAQILSVPGELLPPPTDDEVDEYRRTVRMLNDEYAALIVEHPSRFGAFASLPLDNVDAARSELSYALDELGLDGVLLPSNYRGRCLGDPWYEPSLAELADRGTPVFVHPVEPPNVDTSALGRPSWIAELPFETARTVVDALFHGTLTRNPDLVLILAHCGGALPTLAPRLAEHARLSAVGRHDAVGARDDPTVSVEDVREALGRLYYDAAIAGGPANVLPALESAGPGRVVFGTDWPSVPRETVENFDHELERLAGRSALDLDDVHQRNVLPLFPRWRSVAGPGGTGPVLA